MSQSYHWLEFPNGVPQSMWGRDHESTLLYAESRAVDQRGRLPSNDPRMRVDLRYATIITGGDTIQGHTDFDCLIDLQAAGMLVYDEYCEHVSLTDVGFAYAASLRRKRAERRGEDL